MTGPEHLLEGKRLLAKAAVVGEATPAGQAVATAATGHLLAALTTAFAAAHLPDRTSWQKAGDA
ncbi:hypothetical protein OG900_33345 [Streptomyces sp. NBC_00433]